MCILVHKPVQTLIAEKGIKNKVLRVKFKKKKYFKMNKRSNIVIWAYLEKKN